MLHSLQNVIVNAFLLYLAAPTSTKTTDAVSSINKTSGTLQSTQKLTCMSQSIKMFWGKHIRREPPLKNPKPTLYEQVERIRQVDAVQSQSTPPGQILMRNDIVGFGSTEELEMITESSPSPDLPPGIFPALTSVGEWFSRCDENHDNCGSYPLKSVHPWFMVDSQVTRPSVPRHTEVIPFQSVLSASNTPDVCGERAPSNIFYDDDIEFESSLSTTDVDTSFGSPLSTGINSSLTETLFQSSLDRSEYDFDTASDATSSDSWSSQSAQSTPINVRSSSEVASCGGRLNSNIVIVSPFAKSFRARQLLGKQDAEVLHF